MKAAIIILISVISIVKFDNSGEVISHTQAFAKYPAEKPFEISQSNPGKILFDAKCRGCHGIDGKRKRFGAADLTKSKLDYQGYYNIISNGKWIMPAWKKKLTSTEISQVIKYIETFRMP